jgi:hypothetical protein
MNPAVQFIEMPIDLSLQYRNFSCARMDKPYAEGFAKAAAALEEGVARTPYFGYSRQLRQCLNDAAKVTGNGGGFISDVSFRVYSCLELFTQLECASSHPGVRWRIARSFRRP